MQFDVNLIRHQRPNFLYCELFLEPSPLVPLVLEVLVPHQGIDDVRTLNIEKGLDTLEK